MTVILRFGALTAAGSNGGAKASISTYVISMSCFLRWAANAERRLMLNSSRQKKKSNKYALREIPRLAQRVRAPIRTHATVGFLSVTSAGRRVSKRSRTRVEATYEGLDLGARVGRKNLDRKHLWWDRSFTHWTFLWVFSPENWENALSHTVQMCRLNLMC